MHIFIFQNDVAGNNFLNYTITVGDFVISTLNIIYQIGMYQDELSTKQIMHTGLIMKFEKLKDLVFNESLIHLYFLQLEFLPFKFTTFTNFIMKLTVTNKKFLRENYW